MDGSAVTIGRCGGTVALASGASQTGFGRTGTVDWQTGSIKTGTFTAVNGEGYFVDTSSGVSTANLPAGSAGAIVSFADYTRTFQTNNLIITPNGAEKIGGVASSFYAQTQGQSITLVYVDATEGWINTTESTGQSGLVAAFICASSPCVATVGDYKIHTFTGPGTFTVACAGNTLGSNTVDYLVVAGGGGGGATHGGGGGAGGYRESSGATSGCYSVSPLGACVSALPVSVQGYTITVGGGGAGAPISGDQKGISGSSSTFSTITSAAGGGGGGGGGGNGIGLNGGSGGGGGNTNCSAGGTGNSPPTSPSQGKDGGAGNNPGGTGGGGGATVAGAASPGGNTGSQGQVEMEQQVQ